MSLDITITTHTMVYAPWEDGADEREQLTSASDAEQVTVYDLTDRNLSEFIAKRLDDAGCDQSSYGLTGNDYARADARMSYSGSYDHPYSGELTETSMHISGTDWSDDCARMAFIEWSN